MSDQSETPEVYPVTYRPWTLIVLAGIALVVDISFIARLVYSAMIGATGWSNVRLAFPAVIVGALVAWIMTNRLSVYPDRLDSRYLWQRRVVRRDEIDHIHDIRPLGGATSAALVLKDGRVVALTWSGAAAAAMIVWLKDVPRRPEPDSTTDFQEANAMNPTVDTDKPYELRNNDALVVAGLSESYTPATSVNIPALWQKFVPYLGTIEGRIGEPYTTYGVCYNRHEGGMDYLCAVEVDPDANLPPEFTRLHIPPQTYAVFTHSGHLSELRSTWGKIWEKWLPESGLKVLPDPIFEKYGPEFNGMTGEGGLTIWIAVDA